ncbi:hypothetical protein V2I01_32885 [Micromonospora sp. BRA006-A]|nr:hypothetical protein [Micromonospora sp. BRA006-A]
MFAAERDLLPHRRFPLAEVQRGRWAGEVLVDTAFNYVHFHALGSEHKQEIEEIARTNFGLMVTTGPQGVSVEADAGRMSPGRWSGSPTRTARCWPRWSPTRRRRRAYRPQATRPGPRRRPPRRTRAAWSTCWPPGSPPGRSGSRWPSTGRR